MRAKICDPKRLIILALALLCAVNTFAQRIYGGQYTAERLANVQKNCANYEWGRQLRDKAVGYARPWVAMSDEELWAMVPGQDLPRTIDVTLDRSAGQAKQYGCLVCGNKVLEFGNYPYNPDFINHPWKITCPSCHSVFPTNDFGKYYQSGIDKNGLFNPAKADKKLLYNTAHPDPKDPLHLYGVDDGFGYIKDGHAYRYVGYYVYRYWNYILNGLTSLSNAFLYTGNKQYAHKAAVLLDRLADVYPDMEWKPYADKGWYHSDGGSFLGKIGGSIWETGIVTGMAADYDKIISGTKDDVALFNFLKKQSEKYQLPHAKGTRALFVKNVDDGILRTGHDAVLSKKVRGNQGMHQLTMATCAVALNNGAETEQWLDWLFEPAGGNISGMMMSQLDRDGASDEGAPGYATIWGTHVSQLAEALSTYPAYKKHNILRDYPQFASCFTFAYRLLMDGKAVPNMGDDGATGLVTTSPVNPQFIGLGYRFTHNPEIGLAAYRANGNKADGLGRDIFAADPDAACREIKRIGKKATQTEDKGHLMSGFGLSLLGAGEGDNFVGIASNYGRTIHHAHPDMLNFDIFGFGHWLAPDQGYPEYATNWPSNLEWTGSTFSHNVVFVDKHPQKEIWSGHTQLYKQLNGFGVFQADGKDAYSGLDAYTRTLLLINGSGEGSNPYIIDIFRVKGGFDHVYDFHGPPGEVTTTGLNLKAQKEGTYAGENIPKGALAKKDFPIGYSYLYNVKRDASPSAQAVIDFKVADGYRGITAADDIHLRMYALTKVDDVALADGDPPQNKPGNPKTLPYVLMHRAGKNLNSTFVSVFEPYKKQSFIKSVTNISENDSTVAVKIELMDGHTDYVLYNPSSKQMKLGNHISLNGTLGYLRESGNKAAKAIIINGIAMQHGNWKVTSAGTVTGVVQKMNKALTGGGWIVTNANIPADENLIGQQLIIATNTERDACYTITGIERSGHQTKILCGPVSFVKGTKKGGGLTDYLYDFEEGTTFTIPLHKVWNR